MARGLAMKNKALTFKQGLQIDLTQTLPTSHHLKKKNAITDK